MLKMSERAISCSMGLPATLANPTRAKDLVCGSTDNSEMATSTRTIASPDGLVPGRTCETKYACLECFPINAGLLNQTVDMPMKTCPFCHEEIRDEATKCRYCFSSLLSSQPDSRNAFATKVPGPNSVIYSVDRDLIRLAKLEVIVLAALFLIGVFLYLYGFNVHQSGPKPDQVVYVLDQSLIRFAKFVAAVLAIFVTVGLFFYGFDIKQVAKETRELADKMRELQRQATMTNDEIQKAMGAVAADRAESQKLLKETRQQVKSLLDQAEHGAKSISELQNAAEARFKQIRDPTQLDVTDVTLSGTPRPGRSLRYPVNLFKNLE
jgi:hypothetical protein